VSPVKTAKRRKMAKEAVFQPPASPPALWTLGKNNRISYVISTSKLIIGKPGPVGRILMDLNISVDNDSARITIIGDIDDIGASKLKTKLVEIQNQDIKEAVFDFANVKFIGSTGIGKLLLFYKAMSSKGGRIKIINMNNDLLTMFGVIKLDKVFDING
jgi:anti-sigma B factor antagonist